MFVKRCLLVALLITLLEAHSVAGALRVPQDFATIQAAVDAASDGDTILVAKGVYLESVEVSVPNLKLLGKKAVIDPGYTGNCIDVIADGVTVSGFKVVNGIGGVHVLGSGSTVTGCLVRACRYEGILVAGGATTIRNNTVTHGGRHGIKYEATLPGHALIEKNVCRGNAQTGIHATGNDLDISRNHCEGNTLAGCLVHAASLATNGVWSPELVVSLQRNDFSGNRNEGLVVFDTTDSPIIVGDNECSDNAYEGIVLVASQVTVEGNRCDGNFRAGLALRTDFAMVSGNTARGNRREGFWIGGGGVPADGKGDTTGELNTVTGNSAAGNGGDGFRLVLGSGNAFTGNKASGNGDDGLDIENVDCSATVVDGNSFSSNGHEGLDNAGTATQITGNTCRKNRRGLGPDIAGKGDAGQGTTAVFESNTFDTGGAEALAEHDNTLLTNP